jgi:hypothetical protein
VCPGLNAETAASATNAGAVGQYRDFGRTLILQWNGTEWQRVPSPSSGQGAVLDAAAVISCRNAWAVGTVNGAALILHWNGAI